MLLIVRHEESDVATTDLKILGPSCVETLAPLRRTEEDPWVVAGEIAERLAEPDFAIEDEDNPDSKRLKLDYARLLANAVRDRIDPDPWPRIQALIQALEDLEAIFSQSGLHDRVVLEALQTLRRILQRQATAPC